MSASSSSHDIADPRGALASRLLIVVADGVRPDVLTDEMDRGNVPALAALRASGGLHTVTASFPSVTGPAYVPFVMGRHPAHVGMPGLRWFDRARSLRWSLAQARSYVGIDIWHTDADLDPRAPTLFDLAQPSLAGLMMIGRGATHGRVGRGVSWMIRAARVHFRGDSLGWRQMERDAIDEFLRRFARVRPRLSMLAVLSPDKFAHAYGGDSEIVRDGIRDVDQAIVRARAIADRDGWGESLRVWVVGDHGHAPVTQHDDLHGWLESRGHRVLAHPKLSVKRPDVALMVGGNAMAHVYLEPADRTRRWWPALATRWNSTLEGLLSRPSIDLAAIAIDGRTVRVHHTRGAIADIIRAGDGHAARWSYVVREGDPLQLGGSLHDLDADAAWHVSQSTPYADSLVQLSSLVCAPRSGDIVLSAAPDWDLRARYEPTDHVSTHGALLREQMEVPLLLDTAPARLPQRTTDVVPSALQLLGIRDESLEFDGRSFL